MTTNLIPFNSYGGFTTAGDITTSSYASPAPTISGFSSVSTDNLRLIAGNITGGVATVVDDGINSIAQAPGAQMDVFGFPFSGGGVRGQLTVSGVTTPSEVNGTWYYQSINTYTYQIYTDSTYNRLVDASGWSAYTGSGTVAIVKQVPAANIVVNTNGYFTKFDNAGQLNLPGNIVIPGVIASSSAPQVGSALEIATNDQGGLGGWGSQALAVAYDANIISTYSVGSTIVWQDNTTATITQVDDYGPTYIDIFWDTPKTGTLFPIILETSNYATATTSNLSIATGNNTWTFDNTGNLTIPGSSGGMIKTVANGAIGITAINGGSDNPAQLMSWTVGETNPDTIISTYSSNATIQSNVNGTINTWKFDNAGNLTLPANTFSINYANGTQVSLGGSSSNISNGTSNVTIATSAGNVVTNVGGAMATTVSASGIQVGGLGRLLSPGGAASVTLNNNGANIPTANITTQLNVTGASGANITANLTAGNISTGGTLTSTGKFGYASGSTVTQTTNRGNGVTINTLAGTIITVSASMVAGEISVFSVTNNKVDATTDIVLVQVVSPNLGSYNVIANPNSGIGGFYLTLQNISGFSISAEAVTIRFMVIKSPNA